MKDLFSNNSNNYLTFRPNYPDEMLKEIVSLVKCKEKAWDCGTGNGQLANLLAKYFEKVSASDISANQIKNAVRNSKIEYKVEKAEQTSYENEVFDLITVAQAIHWFEFNLFYEEVNRVLKKEGIIAIIGYGLIKINEPIDEIISIFYKNIVGKYWDIERSYIDDEYKTIPFPFYELKIDSYEIRLHWNFDQFIGYLKTWSSVKHYLEKNKVNPVDLIHDNIYNLWEDTIIEVRFPIFTRIGKKVT